MPEIEFLLEDSETGLFVYEVVGTDDFIVVGRLLSPEADGKIQHRVASDEKPVHVPERLLRRAYEESEKRRKSRE